MSGLLCMCMCVCVVAGHSRLMLHVAIKLVRLAWLEADGVCVWWLADGKVAATTAAAAAVASASDTWVTVSVSYRYFRRYKCSADWPKVFESDDDNAAAPDNDDDDLRNNSLHLADTNVEVVGAVVVAVANVAWLLLPQSTALHVAVASNNFRSASMCESACVCVRVWVCI